MPQFLAWGPEYWFGESGANKVTRVVGVHPILHPQVITRLAVRLEHCAPQIDEIEVRLGGPPAGRKGGEEFEPQVVGSGGGAVGDEPGGVRASPALVEDESLA